LAHHLDAVEVGHDDVKEHDVRTDFLGLLECFLSTARGNDAETFIVESQRDELCDPGLVVGYQNEWLTVHATSLPLSLQPPVDSFGPRDLSNTFQTEIDISVWVPLETAMLSPVSA
jgi:hypothetical protein